MGLRYMRRADYDAREMPNVFVVLARVSAAQILALAPAARWPPHTATTERTLRSFAVLTEPAVLAVQPWRIAVITTDAATTLEELARRRPTPVPVTTLALINQVEPGTRIAAGTKLKWVVGQPLP